MLTKKICGVLVMTPSSGKPLEVVVAHAEATVKPNILVVPANGDYPERRIKIAELGKITGEGGGSFKVWCEPEQKEEMASRVIQLARDYINSQISHWQGIKASTEEPVVYSGYSR